MKVKITFLGTSPAIPTAKKNHSAVFLSYGPEKILIDCGEGTQRQMRKAGINPCKLTRLLITHWHGDHILGIPGLLQTLALSNYNKTLKVYGPKGTKRFMNEIMKMYVFVGKIKIQVKEVSKKVIDEKDFIMQAEKMIHGPPCLAYSFVEKDKVRIKKSKLKKLKIKGKIIAKLIEGKNIKWKGKTIKAKNLTYTQKGKKITIVTDTRFNNKAISFAKESDLLIAESNYADDEKKIAYEYKHMTAKQAAEIAKKSKSKKLILTHISQRYEKNPKKILKEAKKVFKNTKIAEDLMKLEISQANN